MQRRGVRFGIRSLMILTAIATVPLLILKSTGTGPRYRMIEGFQRASDGSLVSVGQWRLNLDSPVDDFHGMPDGKTRFRELIARLRAGKFEYKVSNPRGFGTLTK